jgi:hypothetical protein
MISEYNQIEILFKKIDTHLKNKTSVFIIGGAALLHYGIGKGYTKDIDIVFEDINHFESFSSALKENDYIIKRKPLTHDRLDIFEMLEKGEFRFDLFVNSVCKGFSLSKEMVKRAKKVLSLDYLEVYICSMEDIVLFKSLSPDRMNDIEDSIGLIKRGIDWNIIYNELIVQTNICVDKTKKKHLVWYFIERIQDLENRKVLVPIKSKVINLYNKL